MVSKNLCWFALLQVPVPILANFLAIELFALLKWWLDHEMPYTPERMDEIYHQLVNPAFQVPEKG